MQQDIDVLPGTTLTPQEEQILFLRLNYTRYKMDQIRRRLLRVAKWAKKDVLELLELNQKQLDARSKIAGSNLGLVLAMAKRVSYYGVEMADLVSEGNMSKREKGHDLENSEFLMGYACHNHTIKRSRRFIGAAIWPCGSSLLFFR